PDDHRGEVPAERHADHAGGRVDDRLRTGREERRGHGQHAPAADRLDPARGRAPREPRVDARDPRLHGPGAVERPRRDQARDPVRRLRADERDREEEGEERGERGAVQRVGHRSVLRGGGVGAPRARAEQLDRVLDVDEPVGRAHLVGPRLDGRAVDLDRPAADAAHEVVVVLAPLAPPVEVLALLGAQHVDVPAVREALERAVDGREADVVAAAARDLVELRGAAEVVEVLQRVRAGGALAGHALHESPPVVRFAPEGTRSSSRSSGMSGCGSRATRGRRRTHRGRRTATTRYVAIARTTIAAPGGTLFQYGKDSPRTHTATPTTDATSMVRRNERVTSWATATGTIIRALTSSSPTTRIDTVTVSAATTATATFSVRTGRPDARANSSSWLTENSAARRPRPTRRITTLSTTVSARSGGVTVEIDPKRYCMRLPDDPPPRPMSSTPPAMPP